MVKSQCLMVVSLDCILWSEVGRAPWPRRSGKTALGRQGGWYPKSPWVDPWRLDDLGYLYLNLQMGTFNASRLLDGIGAWMKKSGLEHGIGDLDLSKTGGITWNDHILWQFWRRGDNHFLPSWSCWGYSLHYSLALLNLVPGNPTCAWENVEKTSLNGRLSAEATSPSRISDQSAEEHSLCIQLVCICMENARGRFVARENGKLHFNGCLRSFKRWIICFTGGSCFGSIPVLQHLQQPGNRESDSPQPWLQLLAGFPDRKRFPGCNCLDDCRAA